MNNYQIDFYNLLSAEITLLVKRFKKDIGDQEWGQLMELIETNELGVAFEGFCDFVIKNKITLYDDQKEQIKILAEAMKIEENTGIR